MRVRALGRRTVLRGGAGTVLALPLLEAMRPRRAAAQAAPRRFVVFATTNGTFPERFWPVPPGAAPPWAATTSRAGFRSGVGALDTTDFALSPITRALEKHRKDLIFVEGVDNYDGKTRGHDGLNDMLRQWPFGHLEGGKQGVGATNGASVDQLIAARIGKETKIPSLQLGVITSNTNYCLLSWYSKDKSAPPVNDPYRVFERLFADASVDPADLERIRAERRSVLDAALAQAGELLRRVPAEDREKLGNYLESVRTLENRLSPRTGAGAGGGAAAATCGKPGAPARLDVKSDANIPDLWKAQVDLLVMALACDLTRVVTIQIGDEGGGFRHPWLGVNEGFHFALCHGNKYEPIAAINTWYAEQFAYLLDRLKAVPEAGRSLFDASFLMWQGVMGQGSSHANYSVPIVLAGSAGGFFRTGRHVRYAKEDVRSLADLYVVFLRSFGVDAQSFGHLPINHRPLDNLRG